MNEVTMSAKAGWLENDSAVVGERLGTLASVVVGWRLLSLVDDDTTTGVVSSTVST